MPLGDRAAGAVNPQIDRRHFAERFEFGVKLFRADSIPGVDHVIEKNLGAVGLGADRKTLVSR